MIEKKLLDRNLFTSIYIKAPSEFENISKLKKRTDLTKEEIEKRIENINFRLRLYSKYLKYFDHIIINKDFNQSVIELKKIIVDKIQEK